MRSVRGLWAGYRRALDDNPFRTNMLTGGVLAFAGDCVCQTLFPAAAATPLPKSSKVSSAEQAPQQLEGNSFPASFSWRRAGGMVTFGVLVNGFWCTLVYPLYRRALPAFWLATPLREGVGSCFIDEFLHLPFVYSPAFFYITGLVQGDSLDECTETIREGWLTSLIATWLIWIPLQTLNFGFVPPANRVLVLNVGCLVYNVQMDFISDYFRTGGTSIFGSPAAKRTGIGVESAPD